MTGKGVRCIVGRPRTPVASCHLVVRLDGVGGVRADAALLVEAHRAARDLARRQFGDPECFTLVFSGRRTRVQSVAHVHVFLLPSVLAKRWVFVRMLAKPMLSWLRAAREAYAGRGRGA